MLIQIIIVQRGLVMMLSLIARKRRIRFWSLVLLLRKRSMNAYRQPDVQGRNVCVLTLFVSYINEIHLVFIMQGDI